MPDPVLMLQSLAAALLVSAICAAASRRRGPVSGTAAVAVGTLVGLAVLGIRPRWPMREDQDRFLGLVLPAVLMLEAALASRHLPIALRLGARLLVSTAVAPVILHGSIYIVDLAGPGSATWPQAQWLAIFAGLGASAFAVWSALEWTSSRSASPCRIPIVLAATIVGASACVMLSGYASGGMNGLPIAGSIAGAGVAATGLDRDDRNALSGFGVVSLLGLLLSGWAFGELKFEVAAILFLTPLLSAIPEAPPLALLKPWVRTAMALTLVAATTAAVTGLTAHRFLEATRARG